MERRALLRQGVVVFALGLGSGLLLLTGLGNPRMSLSAHLGGLLNGMFLILAGLVWNDLRLSPGGRTAARLLALYAAYVNWASVQLGAVLGTSGLTPIAGKGSAAPPAAEFLVGAGLVTSAVAILAVCGMLLFGLRAEPGEGL